MGNPAPEAPARGPLAGLRIVEMAGIGPAPFAGMMLADHGAEVLRIGRPAGTDEGTVIAPDKDILARSRRALTVDLKQDEGVALVRDLARSAEGLIEGFRPGVMERLGLGPAVLCADNPRLVYGRMTGWGQDGPLAGLPGHDLNFIALAGNLHGYGRAGEKPTPPANAVADFGGGGMLLAFGMLAAILHARATGTGQVLDCAMVDGAAVLASMTWSLRATGLWRDERGVNLLDTGAPFYEVYETADRKFISVAAIEPRFYAVLLGRLGLAADPDFAVQMEQAKWPMQKARLAKIFRGRTRDEWCAIFMDADTCFAPVLSMDEAPQHPHNAARRTFITESGVRQPAPAPRYSATPTGRPTMPSQTAGDTERLLSSVGYDAARIASLRARGVLQP
jgi:alpha-methylacyl-CoA racemase